MICNFKATKEDFRFINAVSIKDYGYGLENVRARIKDNKILFEATDSNILVRKSFEFSSDKKIETEIDLYFNPEFFKRLIYLCKQKELIDIEINFEKKTITSKTLMCTITSEHVVNIKYPHTDNCYVSDDKYDFSFMFKKHTLEKMLNSISNTDEHIKFEFSTKESENIPAVVKASKDGRRFNDDKSLIMGASIKHW